MKKFFNGLGEKLKKHKAQILKLLLMLLTVCVISGVTLLVLMAFGVVYYEDGVRFNLALFGSFKSSWYGWIIVIVIQTILSMLLCIIPGAAMAFILLSKAIYPVAWEAFLLSFASVMIASTVMYLIGRSGGYRICERILGKEDCEKSLTLLRDKGTVFFPLMMMFPVFPDDALVMIAGTLKMSLKWFIPSIVLGRGIGIATIVFGLSLTSYFTTVWHWVIFIAVAVVGIVLLFYFANKLNKHISSKEKMKEPAVSGIGKSEDSV